MFKNRNLAAKRLAQELKQSFKQADFVSAVSMNSIEAAEVLANEYDLPVNHVVSTKLFVPGKEDLIFGAVSHDGTIWLNDSMIEEFMIDRDFIADYADRRRVELQNRMHSKGIEVDEDVRSKDVLLVADGISSGMLTAASLGSCIKRNVGKKKVAAPFISEHGESKISGLADEIFSIKTPRFVASVEAGYVVPEEENILKF